jgi:uncharacterized MAPEG superfamily protein
MPIAAWCLLAMVVIPYVTVGLAKVERGYNNHEPRLWAQTLEGRARRAHAAHANSFEALAVFVSVLLIAIWTDAPSPVVDELSVVYVLLRIFYVAAYIADKPVLRSVLWSVAFLVAIGIALSGFLPHE